MSDRIGCSQPCGGDAARHVCHASRHPSAGREGVVEALGADVDVSVPTEPDRRILGANDKVKTDQMLLPLPDAESAVLVEGDGARVVDVAVATRSGLLVRLLIEEPVDAGDVSKPGFFP